MSVALATILSMAAALAASAFRRKIHPRPLKMKHDSALMNLLGIRVLPNHVD